ncbi:type VI secretion system-associated FHA domain protein TagH [Rhodoferax sp.]|uniref:type VI secretion system-associated FHA domain protein TagH n=1 Tax=Rhodoferax sp. TaxID=50421 RepID=UPI002754CCFD|nr:type VI secretion system-associated FHA domain protein TagH [Rhodoferax sp.]
MQILVVSHRGVAVSPPRSASFGPEGGSIGRADSSSLVLDDPERTVSRVHAQVLCRGDQFFVVDRGSNPLLCNGHPLGAGNEAALSNGDRLTIGSFELLVQGIGVGSRHAASGGGAVQSASVNAVDDPFADLLVGLESPRPSQAAQVSRATASPDVSALNRSPLFDDPMGSAASTGSSVDPFADLLGPQTSGSPPARTADHLNDFSDLAIPSGGSSSSLDQLFGLGAPGGAGDPFAMSPLADPLLQPNTAHTADPMVALQSQAKVTVSPRSDHVAALNQAYVPPTARPTHSTSSPADFSDLIASPVVRVPEPPSRAVLSRVEVGLAPAPRQPAMPTASVQPSAVAPPQPEANELMAAFLRGVGSTHQMPQSLTPELMERIGVILRSATEGTVQLLLSRQEFKREVRAEVTVIGSQRNNPLKFSPTPEVALAHLLGPGIRGFMRPDEAMQDAFNDLRAHQFGVMVGLHAALAHVLTRFTPDALEKRLTDKTAFDALFSASRKAKLWDQFCALHASISQEAEDDFHNLFGKAFSQAYDEQMARFKAAT